MIDRRDGRLWVTVPMVMVNARSLLEAGRAVFKDDRALIDFAEVAEADSSALAVMLGWLRTAQAEKRSLAFANIPVGVRALADLYGVTELLPLA